VAPPSCRTRAGSGSAKCRQPTRTHKSDTRRPGRKSRKGSLSLTATCSSSSGTALPLLGATEAPTGHAARILRYSRPCSGRLRRGRYLTTGFQSGTVPVPPDRYRYGHPVPPTSSSTPWLRTEIAQLAMGQTPNPVGNQHEHGRAPDRSGLLLVCEPTTAARRTAAVSLRYTHRYIVT
jgi:hypothetical protein